MEGKLIVIESGTDSSGKETQSKLLCKRLVENHKVIRVEYPNYDSSSSALIKMYLKGEFGEKAEDVNCYAASTFYAVDRFASFQKEWKEMYENGWIIVADRYTTSNMVHQGAKISDRGEKVEYLEWLRDLEHGKFGLPVPDLVVLLDMSPQKSKELLRKRKTYKSGEERDIHEDDFAYLINSYNNACWLAERYGWKTVNCLQDGKLRSVEDIHSEIHDIVIKEIID